MERLKLLLVLTIADIKAVGPGVWTGWKGELLRTLYYETEVVLTGGHSELARMDRVRLAQDELRAALPDWTDAAFEVYAAAPLPGLLAEGGARPAHQARAASSASRAGGRADGRDDLSRPTPSAASPNSPCSSPDHPAAACHHHRRLRGGGRQHRRRADLHDGRRHGARHDLPLARLRPRRRRAAPRRARRARSIERALKGEVRIADLVDGKRPRARSVRRPSTSLPEVVIDNALSTRHTVLEVSGLDRPGLLYDLTTALGKLNLNIASAHIATFGEKAVDVFYVTDLTGTKITHPGRQAAIRRAMLEVFDGDAGAEQPLRAAAR